MRPSSLRSSIERATTAVQFVRAAAGALLLAAVFTPIVALPAARLTHNWTGSDGNVLVVLLASIVQSDVYPGRSMIGGSAFVTLAGDYRLYVLPAVFALRPLS
jgi:hypothetical protein